MTPPPRWAARGLGLRPVRAEDGPFLRDLFGQTRADEMALSGWPAVEIEAFLDRQFALQTLHYDSHFPDADRMIVQAGAEPIGRLYLNDGPEGRLIVDVSLIAAWRGHGLGAALIKQAQIQTRRAGLGRLYLHVLEGNAGARRLYERMGFRVAGRDGAHWRMDWTPPGAA